MKNIRTRYKILAGDVVITVLFYFSFIVYMKFVNHKGGDMPDVLGAISDSIFYLYQYCWVVLLCFAAILYGLIKKNYEFLWGGIFSLFFSGLVIVFLLIS